MSCCLVTFSQKPPIQWIGAKAEMSFVSNNIAQDFTAHIRAKIGDTFWMSCTGMLGIEGARMLLLRDSLFVKNKLDHSFNVFDMMDFQNILQKDFKIAQMEECLFFPQYLKDSSDQEEKSTGRKKVITKYMPNEIVKYHFDDQGLISKISWTNNVSQSVLECHYSDYRKDPFTKHLFPYSKIMKLLKEDSTMFALSIQYKKLQFNKRQSMPFSFKKNEE
jgi:hypothetical protein